MRVGAVGGIQKVRILGEQTRPTSASTVGVAGSAVNVGSPGRFARVRVLAEVVIERDCSPEDDDDVLDGRRAIGVGVAASLRRACR